MTITHKNASGIRFVIALAPNGTWSVLNGATFETIKVGFSGVRAAEKFCELGA